MSPVRPSVTSVTSVTSASKGVAERFTCNFPPDSVTFPRTRRQ
ncbi:hypothetical protein ABZZ79_17115 [Streptomyces sp. NPDC006458]